MSHRAPYAIQSDTERNLIGRRTRSNRTPNAIQSDGGRNLIGHRTENDDSYCICKPLLLCFYLGLFSFFVPFYLLQTAIFAIFATVSLILLH